MEGSCDLELGLRLRPRDSRHDDGDQVAQLTVIYNGEVCVCENVSEAQAKAILLLASRGAAEGKRRQRTRTPGVDGLTLTLVPPPMPQPLPRSCDSATSAMSWKGNNATSAMSMKRSLQRFLEKRKRLRMQRSHASPY